ncbi:MAG: acyl-CoA dehydrogenase, partial [Candidatus Krumholzibacteriota bacterium]|nr:acyl-CoA dehydrogenase [Candidatus Krumholzibacteriota bacterium]
TEFGLIKHKIGEMAARIFAGRSMVYRTAGCIDGTIALLDKSDPDYDRKVVAKAINEYAVECAMLKVYCSEVLDYCVDESLQIHGGYGFTQEFNAERYYRDSRINRIFEGTNEINRLIVGGELFKKAAKKKLPVLERGRALRERLGAGEGPLAVDVPAGDMAAARERVARAKLALQLAVTEVLDRQEMAAVREEQEIQGFAADGLMEIYAMESALLRAARLAAAGDGWRAAAAGAMASLLGNDGLRRVAGSCREILAASLPAEELDAALERLGRVTRQRPEDAVSLRRRIADTIIEKEACPL